MDSITNEINDQEALEKEVLGFWKNKKPFYYFDHPLLKNYSKTNDREYFIQANHDGSEVLVYLDQSNDEFVFVKLIHKVGEGRFAYLIRS